MSEPLNRQARWIKSTGLHPSICHTGDWCDYGPVTFAKAARDHATAYDLDQIDIQVRCTSSPKDIRTIPVRRVVSYECTLRDASCNAD